MNPAPATAAPEAGAPQDEAGLWRRIDRTDLARTAFVAVCAVAVAWGATWPWPSLPVVALAGLVVGCWPILAEACHDVLRRRMSMELSMLIAIVAAAVVGEWVTSLVITAFVLAAEILEDLSMDRGRDALTDLMAFLPSTVQLRGPDGLSEAALADVRPGQVVVVSPGGRVPVDGTVVAGRSTVDQSRITGESMPAELEPGAQVYAGSINQLGVLEVRAQRVGTASSYGQIVETVRRAQTSPAPAQRLADRLAAYIVYVALAAAAITWLFTRDLTATISVVVVAGACGIAAGTPLAVLAAMARAARTGAFVKGGVHLEALSSVDTVVFDKTGTLTEGRPAVVDVRAADGFDPDAVLRATAGGELYSEHPLGKAIVAHAEARGLSAQAPADFAYEPGRGITAVVAGREVRAGTADLVPGAPADVPDGATAVHVALDGVYAGTVVLADTVRASAHRCVDDLHAMGLRVAMITGDQERTAATIGARLGIDEVRSGLLPEQKRTAVEAERGAGRQIAMVGDGVNDAPALAVANVGIAMGSGTAVARESADVVLISSDLADLTRTVAVARRARRIVLANFAGTLVVDLAGILLAAFALIGPVAAALVHVVSETAFILNSARLIPRRIGRGTRAPVR